MTAQSMSLCARAALAVGGSAAAGSVRAAISDLAAKPRGNWPDTREARRRAVNAVDSAAAKGNGPSFSRDDARLAVDELLTAHAAGRL